MINKKELLEKLSKAEFPDYLSLPGVELLHVHLEDMTMDNLYLKANTGFSFKWYLVAEKQEAQEEILM